MIRKTMKIKIILLLLALAVVAPMMISGPDNKPIMTMADWKADTSKLEKVVNKTKIIANTAAQTIADSITLLLSGDTDAGKVMHKWQDTEGVWHFSDSVPDTNQVTNLTTGEIPKLANDTLVAEQLTPASGKNSEPDNQSEAAELSLFISPDRVSQLKSEAEDIKRMAQARADALEAM
jgi:hypothetical protein